jgi:hypothetical protein
MEAGPCSRMALLLVAALALWGTGCNYSIDFEHRPYLVGDRGNLRFWVADVCGFNVTCTTEVGLPLDAAEIGIEPRAMAAANSDALPPEPLPMLHFSSSRPDVFGVRETWCRDDSPPGTSTRLPCPTDPIISFVIILDLHSEGTADIIARDEEGNVYDRGPFRVRAPLCTPEPTDTRCPD